MLCHFKQHFFSLSIPSKSFQITPEPSMMCLDPSWTEPVCLSGTYRQELKIASVKVQYWETWKSVSNLMATN